MTVTSWTTQLPAGSTDAAGGAVAVAAAAVAGAAPKTMPSR
ncbi:hypothetical protein [Lysobacter gummosus]